MVNVATTLEPAARPVATPVRLTISVGKSVSDSLLVCPSSPVFDGHLSGIAVMSSHFS